MGAVRIPLLAATVVVAAMPAQEPPRLRAVLIDTGNVFADEEVEGNVLFGLANLLHVVTWPDVVAREVWMRPGQRIGADEIAELERNLRRTGLFGAVHAELLPRGDDQADLLVQTRDRFSLAASASVSSVGGVDKLNFRLSDSNLLGSGKSVAAASSRQSDGRHSLQLSWYDPQFLGSRHTLQINVGSTEEGDAMAIALRRPFRRLDDPYSYGVEVGSADTDVDYYRRGDVTASVPQQQRSLRLYGAAGSGPRDLRQTFGLDLRLQEVAHDPATGIDADRYRVPGDTDVVEFGPYWATDWQPRFDKVRRLDAIDYDEDLGLGVHAGARLAARYRAESGAGAAVQPVLALDAAMASSPRPGTYMTLAAATTLRSEQDQLVGRHASAALHAYQLGLPAQTLAASLAFDAVSDSQDLAPQLTLGADNGLRGYPAREFAGDRRLRLNLEDRIDTGLEVLSVRLGLAAFADAGWIDDADAGLDLGTAVRDVGCGLRLGSSHLFGSRVIRIDVAWPLDRVAGEGFGPSVSLAVGQVFTFFGNAEVLGREC